MTGAGFQVVNAIGGQGVVNTKSQGSESYRLNYLGDWVGGS